MLFEILAPNQIQCTLTKEELDKRGIDLSSCSYRDPSVVSLLEELKAEAGKSVDPSIKTFPPITEVVPSSSELIVILTWAEGNIDLFNPEYSTFTPAPDKAAPVPGDATDMPVMLPIDELQAGVIADILTGVSTGTLRDRLKKYLNEDFLEQLMGAFTESGLENIIASVYDEAPENVTQPEGSEKTSASGSVKRKGKKSPRKAPDVKGPERCLSLSFGSLEEAENTLLKAGLKKYDGKSMLFKGKDKGYLLILTPDDSEPEVFDNIKKGLSLLHETREEPASFLTHILEHNNPVIASDAVKHLTQ